MRTVLITVLFFSILLQSCAGGSATPAAQDGPAASANPTQITAPTAEEAPVTAQATATQPPTEAVPTQAAATETPAAQSSAPQAPAGDALDQVIAAMLALGEQKSFRVDQTVTIKEGATNNLIEIIPPDRFRLVNPDMEMVIVGGDAYIKVEGSWMSFPATAQDVVGNYVFIANDANVQEFREGLSDVREAGFEELNGERTRVYEYNIFSDEDNSNVQVKLWVGEQDGLPRRQDLIITDETAEDSGSIINIYKDFNADFEIEAPEVN